MALFRNSKDEQIPVNDTIAEGLKEWANYCASREYVCTGCPFEYADEVCIVDIYPPEIVRSLITGEKEGTE